MVSLRRNACISMVMAGMAVRGMDMELSSLRYCWIILVNDVLSGMSTSWKYWSSRCHWAFNVVKPSTSLRRRQCILDRWTFPPRDVLITGSDGNLSMPVIGHRIWALAAGWGLYYTAPDSAWKLSAKFACWYRYCLLCHVACFSNSPVQYVSNHVTACISLISFSHSTISSCISLVTPSVEAWSSWCVYLWNWIQLAGDSKYLQMPSSSFFHAMAARKEAIKDCFLKLSQFCPIFEFSQIIFSNKHIEKIPDKGCPHCPTL